MLQREGYEDVTVFEKGERVGGVWHHNTYPGAACDIPSHLYEYSFAPNRWSRRYAPQAEIQAYVEGVARRFGVLDKVRTGTEVKSAGWDEERGQWLLETSAGPHEADLLVTACGQLSVPKMPPIPRPGELRGPGLPHRRVAPRRRPRRQARRRDRHRLQRDPGRAGDPARGRPARRLPALARLDPAEDGLRVLAAGAAPSSSASRPCAASTAPRSSPSRSSPPRP